MHIHERAGGGNAAGVGPAAPSAAPPGQNIRWTPIMVVTALLGTLITMFVGDAVVAALVWGILDFAGLSRSVIGWIDGVLVAASVVPAWFLFRGALANELELADPGGSGLE